MRLSALPLGNKFIYQGKEYTKTNHNRGFYKDENGQRRFKSFKSTTNVELIGEIKYYNEMVGHLSTKNK